MARVVYQLVAVGLMGAMDAPAKTISKKVFVDRQAAEDYKPQFIADCLERRGDRDWGWMERVDRCSVIELELVE